MKIINLLLVTLSLSLSLHADPEAKPASPAKSEAAEAAPLRHVVLFKFKDTATDEEVAAIEKAFSALPSKIETITDYEWGPNVSEANKNDGFTHCFIVTFKDQKGLDVYSPHPAHQEFIELFKPSLEKALVFDYYMQKP
ncbi:MAG: Dabb family protein [Akkermansiaceae bacterium]